MQHDDRPDIELARDGLDYLVPKDFMATVSKRYLPILGMTYALTVLAVAGHGENFVYTLFNSKAPYVSGLVVVFWISIPTVLWIILKASSQFARAADDWYKIIAALMIFILLLSFILFPELNMLGMRTYLAASVPLFGVIYLFFVKGSLPDGIAYPFTVLGGLFLFMGLVVSIMGLLR